MKPERLCLFFNSPYFVIIKTRTNSWRKLKMSSSVGFFAIAANTLLDFLMARVSSPGLVADMMAMVSNYRFVVAYYLSWYTEEHHDVGGNLISSLNNGAMMDYATLVITVWKDVRGVRLLGNDAFNGCSTPVTLSRCLTVVQDQSRSCYLRFMSSVVPRVATTLSK